MNKSTLFVVGMLLLGYAATCQSTMGLKAGVNVAKQVKSINIPQLPATTQDTKSFIGYQLGVFHKSKLHNKLSLAGEVNFSVVGSRMTLFASSGNSYDVNEKLGYIEIPLTLQYAVNKLYFGLGPSVGFKLFSKLTGFEDNSYKLNNYQTLDAAGNVLAGLNLTSHFDVNIRYSHGLVNIYKDPGYAKTKNRFLNLSLLYALN